MLHSIRRRSWPERRVARSKAREDLQAKCHHLEGLLVSKDMQIASLAQQVDVLLAAQCGAQPVGQAPLVFWIDAHLHHEAKDNVSAWLRHRSDLLVLGDDVHSASSANSRSRQMGLKSIR